MVGDAMNDPADHYVPIDDEHDGDMGEEAEGRLGGGLLSWLVGNGSAPSVVEVQGILRRKLDD